MVSKRRHVPKETSSEPCFEKHEAHHLARRRKGLPGTKTVRSTWISRLSVYFSCFLCCFGKKGSIFVWKSFDRLYGIYSPCRIQQSAWPVSQCSPTKNTASTQPTSTTSPAEAATGSSHRTAATFRSSSGAAHPGPGHPPAPAAALPQAAAAATAAAPTPGAAARGHVLPAAATAAGPGSAGRVVSLTLSWYI